MAGAVIHSLAHAGGIANTPLVIGVGQSGDRIDDPGYRAWSATDLAAEAARIALADAGGATSLASRIDCIVTTRTFEDSGAADPIFGKSTNFPRSIARRIGIDPRHAIWAKAGGNSPQDLVTEFCGRVAAGEFEMVLLCGAEATSTIRHADRAGTTLYFAEDPPGDVEDRGDGVAEFHDPAGEGYGLNSALIAYAVMENARRARLRQSRANYTASLGDLFAPLAATARSNPHASWTVPNLTAADLVEVGASNRWIAEPYPLRLVARDQVNLGAAVLIASKRVATELGLAVERAVYLHGHARASEKPLLARPDLGASPAARAVTAAAMKRAGVTVDSCRFFDFYSCFPVAVSNVAVDGLGLDSHDPRGLSVTGGLPYFGGPGNNYSMHAIAEMVGRLRDAPGTAGLVGANGGYMSKYSVGIYSTVPRAWRDWRDESLQADLDRTPAMEFERDMSGICRVESYTIVYPKGAPDRVVIVVRSEDGVRGLAQSAAGDAGTIADALRVDPLGRDVELAPGPGGTNSFRFVPFTSTSAG